MKKYNLISSISAEEMKEIRKELGVTQKEFAYLIGCSKPTVERWECSKKDITGPVAMLIQLLLDHRELLEEMEIPEKKLPIRMWYMYKDKRCTLIDVDEIHERVVIKNYTTNILFTAFGHEKNPSYEEYCAFLQSRCEDSSRSKEGLKPKAKKTKKKPEFDPLIQIKQTEGRVAGDYFWIQLEA